MSRFIKSGPFRGFTPDPAGTLEDLFVRPPRPISVFRPLCVVPLLGASLLAVPSCKRDDPQAVPTIKRPLPVHGPTAESLAEERKKELLAQLVPIPALGEGVNARTPDGELWTRYPKSGLMTHDLRPAAAVEPRWGQKVTIAYTGTVLGAQKPFVTRGPDNPVTFYLGSKDYVKGLNMGLSTMKIGSKRRIFVPPDLGYGPAGSPREDILGNATLIFEVELIAATGEGLPPPPEATAPGDLIGPLPPAGEAGPTSAPATAP
jgi:peptidylprolyl isomerase